MNRDFKLLEDILLSINKIDKIVKENNIENIESHLMMSDEIIYNFIVIGEAANKLSPDFKSKNDFLPFKNIIGMRNKLVHDYEGVNLDIIEVTIKHSHPKLKKLIMNQIE